MSKSISAVARVTSGVLMRARISFLDGDALLDGAAFQVGNSRRAEQGLVEMDMAVHQPRRDQPPRHIDLAHAFRCCQTFEYFGELPIANENVGGPAID